jgi:16S rRNA processing protein RimM
LTGNASAERSVEIGVVGRPHGVRGALHVFLHNPASGLLDEVESVALAAAGSESAVAYRVVDARRAGNGRVLFLEGVERRDQAEALNGARVLVDRSALPPPAEGEYYVADLIGLEVRAGGAAIGTVVASRAQGGVEVLSVRGATHDVEIPFVADFVVAIDLEAARIEVRDVDDLPRTPRRPRRDDGV